MPKYFEGTKDLPPEVIEIEYNAISEEGLERILSQKNGRLRVVKAGIVARYLV